MTKDMCSRNRPKFNTEQQVDPERRGPRGGPARIGSGGERDRASEGHRGGHFGDSSPSERPPRPRRRRAAPEVCRPTSTSSPRPSATRVRAAAGVAVELAAAALAGGETEASSRPGTAAAGPDVEPDAQPARRGHSAVGRRVDVPADVVARANPSRAAASRPGGYGWR